MIPETLAGVGVPEVMMSIFVTTNFGRSRNPDAGYRHCNYGEVRFPVALGLGCNSEGGNLSTFKVQQEMCVRSDTAKPIKNPIRSLVGRSSLKSVELSHHS